MEFMIKFVSRLYSKIIVPRLKTQGKALSIGMHLINFDEFVADP